METEAAEELGLAATFRVIRSQQVVDYLALFDASGI